MDTTHVAKPVFGAAIAAGMAPRKSQGNGGSAGEAADTGLHSPANPPAVRQATAQQRRRALVICGLLTTATALLSPFAARPWPNFPAFIPSYQTAAMGTCLITAALMYGHCAATKSGALLHLSAGYAYAAGVLALQFLSFPGVLVESGRLLGGPRSAIWLWAFWHIGPAASILFFAHTERTRPQWCLVDARRAVALTSAALVLALLATALLVTVLHDELPVLDVNGDYSGSAVFAFIAVGVVMALVAALLLLWRASSFRKLLHVWLGVVAVALLCDNALTLFAGSRLAMGWYVGRLVALLAFSVMMMMYLHEVFAGYRRSIDLAGALASSNGQLDRQLEHRTLDAQRLLEADRSKDEFLVTLAHELRGPLAPLSYVAHLMSQGAIDQKTLHLSQVLQRQVRQMTALVDDLLDVSRVTRGSAVLRIVTTDARRIVADAVEQVSSLIESKQQLLVMQLPEGPVALAADPARMVQVMTNLLNNAAKYTPPAGSIWLRVEARDDEVFFSVTDNGIGMTPELVSRAFELFSQGELTSERSGGGLGVGLALVKSLVELHGGRVRAYSEGPGRGSEFEVTLPTGAVRHPERGVAEEVG